MANFKGWEIIIVLALLLLLFGAKRLPDAARGLGRSMRIFKAETKGLRDDDEPDHVPSRPRGRPLASCRAAPATRAGQGAPGRRAHHRTVSRATAISEGG